MLFFINLKSSYQDSLYDTTQKLKDTTSFKTTVAPAIRFDKLRFEQICKRFHIHNTKSAGKNSFEFRGTTVFLFYQKDKVKGTNALLIIMSGVHIWLPFKTKYWTSLVLSHCKYSSVHIYKQSGVVAKRPLYKRRQARLSGSKISMYFF